jgi:hypothetical protein
VTVGSDDEELVIEVDFVVTDEVDRFDDEMLVEESFDEDDEVVRDEDVVVEESLVGDVEDLKTDERVFEVDEETFCDEVVVTEDFFEDCDDDTELEVEDFFELVIVELVVGRAELEVLTLDVKVLVKWNDVAQEH